MIANGVRQVLVQGGKVKRGMVKAGDAARSASPPWEPGTMLRSEKWNGDRTVERVEGPEIKLRSGASTSWVKSIPADVVVVPATVTA